MEQIEQQTFKVSDVLEVATIMKVSRHKALGLLHKATTCPKCKRRGVLTYYDKCSYPVYSCMFCDYETD